MIDEMMDPMQPVLRAVLLGASNLKMGLPRVVRCLRVAADGPVDVSGRLWTWPVLRPVEPDFFRRPGAARRRGLRPLEALAGRPPLPTLALVMDIGNDLLYGPATAEIAAAFQPAWNA